MTSDSTARRTRASARWSTGRPVPRGTELLPAARALTRLGGQARLSELLEFTTVHHVRTALAAGQVHRVARGRYTLPDLSPARSAAAQLAGAVSHESAAAELGLAALFPPTALHVTVAPNSHPRVPPGVRVHWARLRADDVARGLTSPARTVLDCAATLPFREALAIADSAVRDRRVTTTMLVEHATRTRGPHRARRLRIAGAADGRAANPFESALRAVVLDVGVGGFRPQFVVPGLETTVRVDLADPRRRVVLEADSFEHHGSRQALVRDCRRYDELVRAGWTVLRSSWSR